MPVQGAPLGHTGRDAYAALGRHDCSETRTVGASLRGRKRMSDSDAQEQFEGPWWRYPILRNALCSGALSGAAYGLAHTGLISHAVELALYLVAIPLGAYHWAWEALEELVEEWEVGIDLLMLAAGVGSCLLGLWEEAAFLAFLYGAAEGLEEFTYARTRSAIRSLLTLVPAEARVLRDGREETVAAATLRPGDRFLVRPGESVPTDGVIRVGTSSLDESPVTGESLPVEKVPGMPVFAGTLNHQGAIEIEATAAFEDNSLAKIIHLVEDAQATKGRAQQWIERFGRRYSPAVLLTAGGIMLAPWLVGFAPATWTARALAFLVAAAPCALVMSMPVAMAAGISRAGRRGILIKGGVHLEHLGAVGVVAFDKTGTLTEGRPVVRDLIALDGREADLLALAAGIEHFSEHPLASAIMARARRDQVTPAPVTRFEALSGAGARAVVGDQTVFIGNPALFQTLGVDLGPIAARIHGLQAEGKTIVLLGDTSRIYGFISIQDVARAGIREVVSELRALGLEVAMLTGDNDETARAVARQVGIDEVFSSLKPDDKVRVVQELEGRFGTVLMVGDGINDAPALAAATCGIAMGVAGSDAAIEAADVALMADDLGKVAEAIRLGRRVQRISRQNIVFSLLILAVLIPSALTGVLTVAGGVLSHELAELLAVANGLRAGR